MAEQKVAFGLICHYGIYSYFKYDDIKSARGRNVQNGSEWYYGRLTETNTFRPISGHKATKAFHEKNFKGIDYFGAGKELISSPLQLQKLARFAKEIGAGYIILTARHHDGYALWNTEIEGQKKHEVDIVRAFAEACREVGIEYGFYYSWFEFNQSFTLNYYHRVASRQVEELMRYNPKHLWFDGDWKIKGKRIQEEIKLLTNKIKERGIKINDRLGPDNKNEGSYRVYGDRHIPNELSATQQPGDKHIPNDTQPEEKKPAWQHINTIGISWGKNREQENTDFKTGEDLKKLYNTVRAKNGEFLINIGPDEKMEIDERERKALIDFVADVLHTQQ